MIYGLSTAEATPGRIGRGELSETPTGISAPIGGPCRALLVRETLRFESKKHISTVHSRPSNICIHVYNDDISRAFRQVVGPSLLERTRGTAITIRSETGVSACSTADNTQSTASYSWSLVSTTATRPVGDILDESRDPRVLVIPRHTLGFAGDAYVFQLAADFGGVSNAANVTGERSEARVTRAEGGDSRELDIKRKTPMIALARTY